ncbi:RNB domain-containing ribonuclease, partial [Vibrio cholerae]|uniref:RNB domain-containing ribonuclease n=1 Tax=Vibrio cholerae TaxID=666 RepID=UPI001E5B20E1
SHARLTYNQVNETILKPNQWSHSRSNKVEKHLLNLHRLYLNLLAQRQVRGAIDFDTQELAFTLDNKKKIASIDPVIRNDAHRMALLRKSMELNQ